MSGLLGKRNLVAGVPQSVYVCAKDRATVAGISFCNRTSDPVRVSLAITENESVIANKEYVEYNVLLGPNEVLERTSIYVSPYYYITAIADRPGVSAVCWGVESGDPVAVVAVGDAENAGPVWQTASGSLGTIYEDGVLETPLNILAIDTGGAEVTYSSADIPTGLVLDTLDKGDPTKTNFQGTISGTPNAGGTYNAAGLTDTFTITATDAAGGTTDRSFTVLRKFRDGSSIETAASTADAIFNLGTAFQDTGANGWYWLKGDPVLGYEQRANKYYCNFNGAGYALWMMYRDPHGGRGPDIASPEENEDTEYSLSDNQIMFSYEVPETITRNCTRVWLNSSLNNTPESPGFGDFKYGVVIDQRINTWITGEKTANRGHGLYPAGKAGVSNNTIYNIGTQADLNTVGDGVPSQNYTATDLPNYRFGSEIGIMQYGHNHNGNGPGGSQEFETLNFRNRSGTGGIDWSDAGNHPWTRSGWGAIDASIMRNVNSSWGSNGDDRNGSWNRTDRIFAWLR